MKDKLNQFIDNVNGQFIEVSYKDALYQCMDLSYLWIFTLGFPKATIQHLYAYQVFTEVSDLTKQYFEVIKNTPEGIPQDGDLVVWGTGMGPAGHIAIALGGGTTSTFKCFEQNAPLGTNAHIGQRNYNNVLGWLRPKVAEYVPIITDQTKIPQINNMEVQAIRSVVEDQEIEITSLKLSLDSLNKKITELESKPTSSTPSFSNPLANLLYQWARSIEK